MTGSDRIKRKFTGEISLVIFLLTISVYMLVTAQSFSAAASRFPLFSSVIVIILSITIGFQNLYDSADDSSRDGDLVQNIMSSTTDAVEIEGETESEPVAEETRDFWVLMVIMAVFVVLSYVIGLFYSSIVFVTIYGLWRGRMWYQTMGMIILTYIIGLFFITVLDVDLNTGIIESGVMIW